MVDSMSAEQIQTELMSLPMKERRRFIEWMDDHRHELISTRTVEKAQREELELRLSEMENDPSMRIPFGVKEARKLFREFAHARAHKTPTRST
jgi:hypothetical protein